MKLPRFVGFLASTVILVGLNALTLGAARAKDAPTLLTFDDLPATSPGNGWSSFDVYGGLQWLNFGVLDGTLQNPNEGYYRGTVSRKNVAFNLLGDPASIRSAIPFTLKSAYVTECFANHMQLRVQGFLGATLRYDNSYSVNVTAPTLLNFDYVGVDQVTFTASTASQFAMDNVLVLTSSEPPIKVAPPAGQYIGFLQVTKHVDGVIASSKVRANASVSSDGLLTVVLATLQSPTPQDLLPNSADPSLEKGPTDVLRASFSGSTDSILIEFPQPTRPGFPITYTPYPAQVSIEVNRFRLSYTDPARGLSSPPQHQRVTQFEYSFRRTED